MPDNEGDKYYIRNLCTGEKCEKTLDLMAIFFAEFFGTAIFLCIGCLACIENAGAAKNRVEAALAFGLAAFIGGQIFHRTSGGHLNPMVTIISLFFRQIKWYIAPLYFAGQGLGSFLGYGIIRITVPESNIFTGTYEDHGLCTNFRNPKMSLFTACVVEFLASVALGLVVCSYLDMRNNAQHLGHAAYGLAYFTIIHATVLISGCGVNPFRSLAPALLNNSWADHWIYWVFPITAALVCGFFYTQIMGPESYTKRNQASGSADS